jgi:hypothetical protein
MADRVQVKRLERDTQVRPTAQIVDTYVRPEAPVKDDTMERLANALSKITPGIATQAGKKARDDELARAEREFLSEQASGFKITRDNIMSGNEYVQDSSIALKHLQVLRANQFIQESLSQYKQDLFTGGLKDSFGNVVQIGSREELNQNLNTHINSIVQDFGASGDEFIMSAIAPKIREWHHNTSAQWEKKFHDEAIAEREQLFYKGFDNIFGNTQGKNQAQIVAELNQHVDSYYRLADKKSTDKAIKALAALADTTNNVAVIDAALGMTPGGRDLTPQQRLALIEKRESIENEILAQATSANKIAENQRKADLRAAEADAWSYLSQPDANVDSPEFKGILDRVAANGGKPMTVMSGARTYMEKIGTTVTVVNNDALASAKLTLRSLSTMPNNEQALELLVQQMYGDPDSITNPGFSFVKDLHPKHRQELLNYAKSLDGANNYLFDTNVNAMRKDAVEAILGTKTDSLSQGPEWGTSVQELEKDYNQLLMQNLAAAYGESGILNDTQVSQIAMQTRDQLKAANTEAAIAQKKQKIAVEGATNLSLKAWQSSDNDSWLQDDIDDLVIPDQYAGLVPGTPDFDKLKTFYDTVVADPFAEKNGVQAWQQFDAIYWPGAFAYFTHNKRAYFK